MLELIAVKFAMQVFTSIPVETIQVQIDNMTALAYLVRNNFHK